MPRDGNQIYHGDCVIICTNAESLCCIPETNIRYINYTSIKKQTKKPKRVEFNFQNNPPNNTKEDIMQQTVKNSLVKYIYLKMK